MPVAHDQSPVNFQDALPEAVDVVVIGAGVIGISTAWFLNQAGVSVFVCEKGRVAGEQSSRNWGWIRQQGRDAAELPIAIDSINAWEGIAKELDDDIGFTRRGVAYLAADETELGQLEQWLDVASQHQLDSRMLTGNEVDELISEANGQWAGALYTPSDGRAEPFVAVPAMARTLRKRGVGIRESCAVRTIDRRAGNVTGVVTESGTIRADAVVCAGGAWSALLLGNLGINLPQLTVRSTVARTTPAPDIYAGAASAGDFAFRRRADGGYTLAPSGFSEHFLSAGSFRHLHRYLPVLRRSARTLKLRLGDGWVERLWPTRHWDADKPTPFEQTRVLNPEPAAWATRQMFDAFKRRFPAMADVQIEESWAGMIDVMPDVVPVMDEIGSGLFLATGFSGHGFGFGPGAGRVMADMVRGRPPAHDLQRFRFSRFADGSPMRPGPGL